jgi:hypothetical protein
MGELAAMPLDLRGAVYSLVGVLEEKGTLVYPRKMKTLLKKTDAREHVISKEIIEAGDRLRKETMDAIAADPVLSAEMKTIRENAEANIRRERAKKSPDCTDASHRTGCARSVIAASGKKSPIKL